MVPPWREDSVSAVSAIAKKWEQLMCAPSPERKENPNPRKKRKIVVYNPLSLFDTCMKRSIINYQDDKFATYAKSVHLPRFIRNDFLEWHQLLLATRTFLNYKGYCGYAFVQHYITDNEDDDRHQILYCLRYIWEDDTSQYVGMLPFVYHMLKNLK